MQGRHDGVVVIAHGVHGVRGFGSKRLDVFAEVLSDAEILAGRGQGDRANTAVSCGRCQGVQEFVFGGEVECV